MTFNLNNALHSQSAEARTPRFYRRWLRGYGGNASSVGVWEKAPENF